MFSQAELAKVVKDTVPSDRSNAIVGVVDNTGLAVVVKMTKSDHWEIDAAYHRDWGGDQNVGAKVIYSW